MKKATGVLWGILATAALAQGQGTAPAGESILTFVNRLSINPPQVQVFGYFPTIEGIPGSMFAGAPGEGTAYFTWSLDAAGATQVQNGDPTAAGGMGIAVLPAGHKLNVYLNAKPAQSWGVPASFSAGQLVASFQATTGTQVGAGPVSLVTQSYVLVSAVDFTFNGDTYNFRRLIPHGFTMIGLGGNVPIGNSNPPAPPLVFTAAGTAIALGGPLSGLPWY